MDDKFFGEYLVSKGIIDKHTLNRLLEEQSKTYKKIGDLCIEKGLLGKEEVKKIISIQRKKDLPFCEIAKDLNFLTQKQIDDILFLQEVTNLRLGELLIKKNIITSKEMSNFLKEYIQIQKEREKILINAIEKLNRKHIKLIIDVIKNYFLRIKNTILKPIYINKNIDDIRLDPVLEVKIYNCYEDIFYIKIFNGNDMLDDFIEVANNYLSNKKIIFEINKSDKIEDIQIKNNIIFYSSRNNTVILFY